MGQTVNHTDRAHALLSPSAAERWIHCTAAPLLERDVPDTGSPYAEEGTRAHELCELLLRGGLATDLTGVMDAAGEEMRSAAFYYHDLVVERLTRATLGTPDAKLIVEARLDMTRWVPQCWGTGDALIIADDVMEVIDFKYGRGVRVDAVRNAQMMLYALGAIAAYGGAYNIDRVRMTIVQPRLDHVSTWETTAAELLAWARSTVRPAAEEALSGKGRQQPGEWCRFCKVKVRCRALADVAHHVAEGPAAKDSALLTTQELAELLPVIELLTGWGKDVQALALQKALDGDRLPGYKLVEGRSVRVITQPDVLAGRLLAGGKSPEEVYRPRELRTLGELEKLIGRKAFAELADGCLAKPPGKPTLVKETDKRPEWSPARADFADIIQSEKTENT